MTPTKITFSEVENWLYSTKSIPEHFITLKSKLNSIVPYLPEQFWHKPELVILLNDYFNNLHDIPDPIDALLSLQKIIGYRNFTKYDSWKFFPKYSQDVIQKIIDADSLDENNARSRLMMIQKVGAELPIENNTKLDLKTEDRHEAIKEALVIEKEKEIQKYKDRMTNSKRYLKKLTQEVVDELELTLFNVKILKKQNKVLVTFIDKNNCKRYYLEPYVASFYVSKKQRIIDNDYIVSPDENQYIKYTVTDWSLLNKLKFALNHSYKRTMNLRV